MKKSMALLLLCFIVVVLTRSPEEEMISTRIQTNDHETPEESESLHMIQVISEVAAAPRRETSTTDEAEPGDFTREEVQDLEGLPRGMRYLTKVKALPSEQYKREMGKLLLQKNGITFFRSTSAVSEFAHVVYDQRMDTLHPIGSVIQVKGVTPLSRDKHTSKLTEYHYNQEAEIQFLQSDHKHLLDDFEEISAQGGVARLEVIQGVYQIK